MSFLAAQRRLIARYWAVLTLVLVGIVTALSLWPPSTLPTAPGGDKLHHVVAYASVALPSALARPRYWLWVALFLLAYGGLIELLQPATGRYAEMADWLANALGVCIGLGIAQLWRWLSLRAKP